MCVNVGECVSASPQRERLSSARPDPLAGWPCGQQPAPPTPRAEGPHSPWAPQPITSAAIEQNAPRPAPLMDISPAFSKGVPMSPTGRISSPLVAGWSGS